MSVAAAEPGDRPKLAPISGRIDVVTAPPNGPITAPAYNPARANRPTDTSAAHPIAVSGGERRKVVVVAKF
ncbi:hypothetical protein Lesp01_53000 [Lentzea sp. NBRC 102530]|nr:hypothetical protein Lesp01_53000 [Lentzea sp. NBRC 102530]